ncbi:MAG: AI-2E family transporter [Deinococcales bacterium]
METRPTRVVNLLPAALVVLGVLLLWGAVQTLGQTLLLITLALIIAAGLNPAVLWVTKYRIPRGLAAALILFVVLGGTIGLVGALIPALISQLNSLISSIPAIAQNVQTWLVTSTASNPLLRSVSESLQSGDLAKQLQGLLSAVPSTLLSALGATSNILNGALLGMLLLLMGFTVLISPEPLLKGAIAAVPNQYRDEVSKALAKIGKQTAAWLTATLILSFVMGLAVGLGLWGLSLFGIQSGNILLWSVIAGVSNIIPVVGSLFGLIPPVLSSLSPSPQNAIWVALVIFMLQQIVFNVLSPIVMSRGVSLHPASLLVGVLLFSGLFGVIGAFLAVPFLIICKALYEELYLPAIGSRTVTDEDVAKVLRGEILEPQDTKN